MANRSDTPMKGVAYRTPTGGSGLAQTVERAINYIDDDVDRVLAGSHLFVQAKEALLQALEGKRSVANARLLFMAALSDADLLVI